MHFGTPKRRSKLSNSNLCRCFKLAICLNFEVPVFDFPEDPTYFRSILLRTENMGSDLNNSAVIRSLKVPILQLLCTAVHVINSLSFGLIPSFSFSNYLCSSPKQDVMPINMV